MKQKAILILALLAFVSLMIAPVMAETLTGSLGSATLAYLDNTTTGGAGDVILENLAVHNIETTWGLQQVILLSTVTGNMMTYNNATVTGNTTPFSAKIGSTYIGNGTMGFQRHFIGAPPVEQVGGYVYLIFTDYNPGSYTGDQNVILTYNTAAMYAVTLHNYISGIMDGVRFGWVNAGGGMFTGELINVYDQSSYASYTTTKPSGLRITGYIDKTVNGIDFPSQAYVFDGTTDAILASNYAVNTQDLNFNVYAESIKIGIKSTWGTWYNTSILFSAAVPTVTPTPYQIIDPIPPGYTRTWFINSDGQTGGSIQGSFIDLYDVQNASWRNTTLSMSVNGNLARIDTLPNHTINAYGHAVGYDSDTRMGLPAADTVYELILWSSNIPSVPAGNVNLFVIVSASPSGMALTNAQVTASKPGGGWDAVLTGISGTASFVMPNMSLIYVSASKSGYGTVTSTITTTALGPDTLRITLPKLTVTPTITATPLPGEATARPTYAPGCDPSAYDAAICNTGKDSAMMDQIRDAGPTLIGLAIIATMLGLIKLMAKK